MAKGIASHAFLRVSLALGVAMSLGACRTTETEAGRSQGWTAAEQSWWYEGKQGSRMMPYAWFKSLEQPASSGMFGDATYLASFGFLPRRTSFGEDLPVGVVKDDNDDRDFVVTKLRWYKDQKSTERWVGLNCSACHTGEISYQGTPIRIDGGPSLLDFQQFVEAMDAALRETRDDPAKFDRFADRVLEGRPAANRDADRAALKGALTQLVAWEDRVERQNATPLRYGYARVDAFGHIYNKTALYTGATDPTPNPSDAPVSYPFLWGIARHDKLQWNGIAQSARLKLGGDRYLDYGAMGRNAGEVIGVFGEVVTVPGASLAGYKSSIWADNLDRLEKQLARLRPPAWPAAMGIPDPALVAQGSRLFQKNCVGCHAIPPSDNSESVVSVRMVPFTETSPANQTDVWMACNAFTYQAKTGVMAGTKDNFLAGAPLGPTAPLAQLLPAMVKGTLVGKKGQLISSAANSFLGLSRPPRVVTEGVVVTQTREQRRNFCLSNPDKLLAYKSRPLEGIWATAPYLHNGSVPSLYDLLLPAAQRPRCFELGGRNYDPVNVGYAYDRTKACKTQSPPPAGRSVYYTQDDRGQPIDGNSNAGHDYGSAAMSEAGRKALVEYMKTL